MKWFLYCASGLSAAIVMICVSAAAAQTTSYSYDQLGRISSATQSNGTVVTYSYDLAGNRTVVGGATNRPPVAVDDGSAAAPLSSPSSVSTLTISVLGNDTDADSGDANNLVVNSIGGARRGTVRPSSDNKSIIYTANFGQVGADSFQYTITDGRGATSAPATVYLNVVNQAPVANAQIVDQYQSTTVKLTPLANDTDADGDPLTLTSIGPLEFVYGNNGTPTDLGTITQLDDNTVLYKAPFVCNCALRSKYSVIRFPYTISDGKGGTASALHAVNVYSQPPNAAPTSNTGSTSVWQATSNTITPLANDTDPDGDALSIASIDNFYFAYGKVNGIDLSSPPRDIGSVVNNGTTLTYRAPFLTSSGSTGSSYIVVVVWYTATDSRGGMSQSYEVIANYAPQ